MKFSLIICGYNEEKNLDVCIQSCLAQNYPKGEYEIIYVDNNSKDASIRTAEKYPIKVLFESKQGLSEARNCGIDISIGDILVFLDGDTKLDADYLKYHEDTFANPNVAAGGGKVLPLIKTWVSDYLGVSLFEGYPRFLKKKLVKTYPGCNLTIRRKVLVEVGPFKEGLITQKGITRFAEDKEICERIRMKGYHIMYNPMPVIYHKNTFSFTKLFLVWIKGSKCRINLIRLGKKDLFSRLFNYNLPLLYLALLLISLLLFFPLFVILILLAIISIGALSLKSSLDTGLIFHGIFIKPWMDSLSLLVINVSIIYFRWKTS